MVIRRRFSFQEVRDVLGCLLEQDLHYTRAICVLGVS
jgi:hypothetical protein